MQSDIKQIAKLTSERTNKDEQLYKDLSNFVFSEVYSRLRKPRSLIIKLKGVGSWFLRKSRMSLWVNQTALSTDEDKLELRDIFRERLVDYEEYIKLKNEIKQKRHESQKIFGSKEESDKSSQV